MAGIVGGGGLGDIAMRYGYYRYEEEIMFVAVVLLGGLVQIFQTLGMKMAVKLDRRQSPSSAGVVSSSTGAAASVSSASLCAASLCPDAALSAEPPHAVRVPSAITAVKIAAIHHRSIRYTSR